jgi:cytochrome b561
MSRALASRYHPVLVALHWLLALMIIGLLFAVFPTFQTHAVLATLLAILIAAHIGAALYHRFVLKDGLFRRVWFGQRTIAPAEK